MNLIICQWLFSNELIICEVEFEKSNIDESNKKFFSGLGSGLKIIFGLDNKFMIWSDALLSNHWIILSKWFAICEVRFVFWFKMEHSCVEKPYNEFLS